LPYLIFTGNSNSRGMHSTEVPPSFACTGFVTPIIGLSVMVARNHRQTLHYYNITVLHRTVECHVQTQ